MRVPDRRFVLTQGSMSSFPQQVMVEFKACRIAETGLDKLAPALKLRLTADAPSPARIALVSRARAARPSLPLLVGVGF